MGAIENEGSGSESFKVFHSHRAGLDFSGTPEQGAEVKQVAQGVSSN